MAWWCNDLHKSKQREGFDMSERAEDAAGQSAGETWVLQLYVADMTPQSKAAFANLKRLCTMHLAGKHRIDVTDVKDGPQLARTDNIVATPTVSRRYPLPVIRLIGDLSDTRRVRWLLNL